MAISDTLNSSMSDSRQENSWRLIKVTWSLDYIPGLCWIGDCELGGFAVPYSDLEYQIYNEVGLWPSIDFYLLSSVGILWSDSFHPSCPGSLAFEVLLKLETDEQLRPPFLKRHSLLCTISLEALGICVPHIGICNHFDFGAGSKAEARTYNLYLHVWGRNRKTLSRNLPISTAHRMVYHKIWVLKILQIARWGRPKRISAP